MTLIVCLKAKDCVVFAADSLSTITRYGTGQVDVLSRKTTKLHTLQDRAVAGGCGMSRIQGVYWGELIEAFTPTATAGDFGGLTADFRTFIDQQVARLNSDPGARRGGNTFLLAGFDAVSGGMKISKIVRNSISKTCDAEIIVSGASSARYIEFIGDTTQFAAHIAQFAADYDPGMTREAAEDFAANAIFACIAAAQSYGVSSIGGDVVSVATVSQNGVAISTRPTPVPCP